MFQIGQHIPEPLFDRESPTHTFAKHSKALFRNRRCIARTCPRRSTALVGQASPTPRHPRRELLLHELLQELLLHELRRLLKLLRLLRMLRLQLVASQRPGDRARSSRHARQSGRASSPPPQPSKSRKSGRSEEPSSEQPRPETTWNMLVTSSPIRASINSASITLTTSRRQRS